jgi:hypothetical protein
MRYPNLFNFSDGTYLEFSDFPNYAANFIASEILWGALFLAFGVLLWLKGDEDGYALTAYLIVVGGLGTVGNATQGQISYVFAIMLAMGIGLTLYRIYESRKTLGR